MIEFLLFILPYGVGSVVVTFAGLLLLGRYGAIPGAPAWLRVRPKAPSGADSWRPHLSFAPTFDGLGARLLAWLPVRLKAPPVPTSGITVWFSGLLTSEDQVGLVLSESFVSAYTWASKFTDVEGAAWTVWEWPVTPSERSASGTTLTIQALLAA